MGAVSGHSRKLRASFTPHRSQVEALAVWLEEMQPGPIKTKTEAGINKTEAGIKMGRSEKRPICSTPKIKLLDNA